MQISDNYLPSVYFVSGDGSGTSRAFISPARYLQGPGQFAQIGPFLKLFQAQTAGVLISKRSAGSEGRALLQSIRDADVQLETSFFQGECSLSEIERHVAFFETAKPDILVAAGGGKAIDTGKAIADRLSIPVVIAPTLASNDAPCSAVSVLYDDDGVSVGAEFYCHSPALVLVDTEVVAAASARYLVSGMGDAMATWYEAEAAGRNPHGFTTLGTRPTLAARSIGKACRDTLFAQGASAAAAVAESNVTEALEDVVEANTLLSGIGFESGGLAAAHGFAQALTALPQTERNYLHGEMVAFGTLAQLAMEKNAAELERVARFFAAVGLPVSLEQLSVSNADSSSIDTIVQGASEFPFIGNMPVDVTPEALREAVINADELGSQVQADAGDAAYRLLHRSD